MSAKESEPPTASDRRGSYRCAVKGPRRQARLRTRHRDISVRALDESLGGFAVIADESPPIQVGDSLLFEIASAWAEVRVVSLEAWHEEPDETGAADEKAGTRVGLRRVRDLEPWEIGPDELPRFSLASFRTMLMPLTPLSRSFKLYSLMIVGVVAVGGIVIAVLENAAPLAEELRAQAAKDRARAEAPAFLTAHKSPDLVEIPAEQPRIVADGRETTVAETKTADTQSPAGEAAEPQQASRPAPSEKLVRLAQPDFLLKPDVVRLLSLTRKQRDQLRRLFEEPLAVGETPGDRMVRLGREVLEVLTEEQRRLLAELLASLETVHSPSAGSPPAAPPTGNR